MRRIGEGAFYNCTSLFELTIQNGVEEIDAIAFGSCTGLMSVVFPDSVTMLGERMFSECINLGEVILPKNITEIKDYTFEVCVNLERITIPKSVITMGTPFSFCHSLRKIYCQADNKLDGWDENWAHDGISIIWGQFGLEISIN